MKYEENVWYGWNGGECPVHPETVVDAVASDDTSENHPVDMYSLKGGIKSGRISPQCWQHGKGYRHIIAFRVIKEHKEPREWWCVGKHLHDTMADAEKFCDDLEHEHPGCGYGNKGRIIHVREVQE